LQEAKSSSIDRKQFKFEMSTISYTPGNTQVPYVTISSLEPSKKNIIILARQHPGEVWSSFLTESIIRELMRDSNIEKDWLLKNYSFRIFPMINVDGVIYGNFRCDLSGMDLNRCWKNANKLIHPHLYAIK
jgi:murein tripeptide amidase MpaA